MYYQLRDQRLLDFANWTSTNYLTVQISYAAFTGIGVQVIKKKTNDFSRKWFSTVEYR